MATSQRNGFLPRLRTAVLLHDAGEMADAHLLGLFIECRDEAAFAALVRRHGPMVWGVCRRVLDNHHDAEDAFQATFLVLAHKAASIAPRAMVGNWLYGVAYRTARKANTASRKRRAREKLVTVMPEPEAAEPALWRDLQPLLDRELECLPDSYRAAVVLCDLEGKTHKEAARQLGWPVGTLSTRLTRARALLAKRLTRQGLFVSGGALAAVLAPNGTSACVPTSLVASTIKAAIPFAAGKAAAGLVSASVATLTEGVLPTMFLTKLKIAAAVLLTLAVVGTGAGIVSQRTLAVPPDGVQAADSFQTEGRRQEQERRENAAAADTEQRPGEERQRDVRKPPAFQGKITAVSEDGKSLTLEGGAARGEEPKKITVKLTDKTTIEFAGLLKDLVTKLKVGDAAAIWFQEGSTEMVAVLQAQRPPDLAGKITAVAGEEKSLTLEVPSRERGAAPEKIEVKLTGKTKKGFGRGEEAKLTVGNVASVWLQEGSKDTAAALQVSRPRPDAVGVITAISADGKVLTVESKGRSGEVMKTQVQLGAATKLEFINGEAKKLRVGHPVTVWLQEGSTETAAVVQANLQRRSPDVTGTIAAISPDGKLITLEIRRRGEDQATQTPIKLTDKTEVEFAGTDKAEEKKLTVGYTATVWLQEGSKDTAAVFLATKPKERGR